MNMIDDRKVVLVRPVEMGEYVKMIENDELDCLWIPEQGRRETYPEAYRRKKDEEKAKGSLKGWT